eukprot:tig00021244_g19587.t1
MVRRHDGLRFRIPRIASLSLSLRKKYFAFLGLWALNLLYFDEIVYYTTVSGCAWPAAARSGKEVQRVALIADPQLTDRYSRDAYPRTGPVREVVQLYSDVYMKKAFRHVLGSLRPDAVVFLGDVFDGGRHASDAEFDESLARYQRVFGQQPAGRARARGAPGPVPVYHIAGNHDVGIGREIRPDVAARFEAAFGPSNHVIALGGFSLVAVNAPALAGGPGDPLHDETLGFVRRLSAEARGGDLRVLLTHIPLHRPEGSGCGAARRPEPLRQCAGEGYQCLLEEGVSRELLAAVRPLHVFSGDDHFDCSVEHAAAGAPGPGVPEETLATFSWLQGNPRPGFALATLSPEAPHVRVARCALPNMYTILLWYALLGLMTAFHLLPRPKSFLWLFLLARARPGPASPAPARPSRSPAPPPPPPPASLLVSPAPFKSSGESADEEAGRAVSSSSERARSPKMTHRGASGTPPGLPLPVFQEARAPRRRLRALPLSLPARLAEAGCGRGGGAACLACNLAFAFFTHVLLLLVELAI